MTAQQIAEAVGKDARTVQRWIENIKIKVPKIGTKLASSSPSKPADYELNETIEIIKSGMGIQVASVFALNAGVACSPESTFNVIGDGFVYIAFDSLSGYTKIGMTNTTLKTRLSSMRTSNPHLKIYGSIHTDSPRQLEAQIHASLKEKNVCGEWFNLTKQDIDSLIKKYRINLCIEKLEAAE